MIDDFKERILALREQGYSMLEARRIVNAEDKKKRLVRLAIAVNNGFFVRRKHVLELIDIIAEMQNAQNR